VTQKGKKTRDPNALRARYLENGSVPKYHQ